MMETYRDRIIEALRAINEGYVSRAAIWKWVEANRAAPSTLWAFRNAIKKMVAEGELISKTGQSFKLARELPQSRVRSKRRYRRLCPSCETKALT